MHTDYDGIQEVFKQNFESFETIYEAQDQLINWINKGSQGII